MLATAPLAIDVLFVVTVIGTLALVLGGASRAAARVSPGALRGVRVAAVAAGGWLALTAALTDHGFFDDFYALPPHMLLAVGPPLLGALALIASGRLDRLLAAMPPSWPIGVQAFRIAVEIVLWRLAVAGVAPEIMAFTGRNVDILVGLTAPIVAYFCFVRRTWPARVAWWWNWAGVLVLLNVVVHAQLSAPTRFRVFATEPATTFIGDLPYIWLPAVLVPLAWALHAASLRQLRSRP